MSFIRRVFTIDPELTPPPFGTCKYLILDLETTGLEPKEDVIICGGFLDYKNNRAYVYFLPDPMDHAKFWRFLRNTVLWYHNKGYTVWAYNNDFECSFLELPETIIRDLMIYRVSTYTIYEDDEPAHEIPQYFRAKMVSTALDIIRHYYPKFFLKKDEIPKKLNEFIEKILKDYMISNEIPKIYYKKWLLRRDPSAVDAIIHHNFVDLFLELWILWYFYEVIFNIRDYLLNFAEKTFNYLPAEIEHYLGEYF